jgi:hypothetical protein
MEAPSEKRRRRRMISRVSMETKGDGGTDTARLVAFLAETADGPFHRIEPSPGRSISINAFSDDRASLILSSDPYTIERRTSLLICAIGRLLTHRNLGRTREMLRMIPPERFQFSQSSHPMPWGAISTIINSMVLTEALWSSTSSLCVLGLPPVGDSRFRVYINNLVDWCRLKAKRRFLRMNASEVMTMKGPAYYPGCSLPSCGYRCMILLDNEQRAPEGDVDRPLTPVVPYKDDDEIGEQQERTWMSVVFVDGRYPGFPLTKAIKPASKEEGKLPTDNDFARLLRDPELSPFWATSKNEADNQSQCQARCASRTSAQTE